MRSQTNKPIPIGEAAQIQLRELRLRPTTGIFEDLSNQDKFNQHARFFISCANEILLPIGRKFSVDDNNRDAMRFLLYYFNQCEAGLQPERYYDEKFRKIVAGYSLDKNLMICGGVGTGKTLMMDAFAMYLKRTKNPMAYTSTSVTEMLNYYKVNDHLDYYTYNCGKNSYDGRPEAFCLNDVGLDTQKYFGNDLQVIIDEYFHARNEIYTQYGKRSHITTNLGKKQIAELFNDPYGRLQDRFKTYNVIPLGGDSRR